MRNVLFCIFLMASSAVLALEVKPVDPPPPPPMPSSSLDDAKVEPQVTIVQKDDATITEYRVAGKLYMMKVKPKVGPEYYLSDDDGTGKLVRRDGQPVLRPPMWVIKRF